MDKIYPTKPVVAENVTLSPEETLILKKGIVMAAELEIAHPQDIALYALQNSGFAPGRISQIHNVLSIVQDLESAVSSEAGALKAIVEASYKPGDTADKIEAIIVAQPAQELVDTKIYAERLIQSKTGAEFTPIIKPVEPKVIEEIIEKIEIIK